MARPKRVPRRLSRGGDRARQGEEASRQGEDASSSTPVSQTQTLSQARNRRYEAHSCVLRELRRIECHMQPAIPRLPFQRLVREICEQRSPNIRWTASRLLCLQEVVEDWLVEFFEDSYLLAAFAHRLTIFPKDFEVLRRLRYRATRSQFQRRQAEHGSNEPTPTATAEPTSPSVPISQAEPTLLVPTATEADPTLNVQIAEPATGTEAATAAEAATATKAQTGFRPDVLMTETKPLASTQAADVLMTETLASTSTAEDHYGITRERELREIERHNLIQLDDLSNHGDVRLAFRLGDEEFSRNLVGTLTQEDLMVLQNPDIISVTDSLMQLLLWYCLSTLPPEVQGSTYFVDSLISSHLRNKEHNFLQVINWFRGVNLDKAKLVLLAYQEE
ncbi:hypothetical protein L7F22_004882 [Adiantum nelumboides]|nr:hypothetical protein [Adiantum nelumboides]